MTFSRLKRTLALLSFAATNANAVAPSITSNGPTDIDINQTYAYQVEASDPEGGSLTYSLRFGPEGLNIDANGMVTWPTSIEDAGKHTFKVVVHDDEDLEDEQYVHVDVRDPNNSPPIFNGTAETEVFTNQAHTFDPQVTDTDGDTIIYSGGIWPEASGFNLDTTSGIVSWMPEAGQEGHYWIWIFADDQRLGKTKYEYEIRVYDPSNNPPIIQNKLVSTNVNVGQLFQYDMQAADADGDPLNYSLQVWPSIEGATISSTGIVEWTPSAEHLDHTYYYFMVKVDDGKLGEDSHTVKVAVINTGNQSPIISSTPTLAVEVDTTYQYDVNANDPENDALTFGLISSPAGMTIDAATGVVDWLPTSAGDFPIEVSVSDSINPAVTQSFTLTVTPPFNTAPTANDSSEVTSEDIPVTIALSATDADGNTLSYTIISQPEHGLLSGTAPNLTYTPSANYFGSDSFTFQVNDGEFDSNIAAVNFDITSVNDVPTASGQSVNLNEDESTEITLSGSDNESTELTFNITNQPANGVLSGTAPNLVYTPNNNFFGSDSFTYVVNDGEADSPIATVTINVSSVNDSPVAQAQSVSTNEDTAVSIVLTGTDEEGSTLIYTVVTQPTNGMLSGAAPNLTYTPNENYFGTETFNFIVNDGESNSEPALITIEINSVNDAPEFISTAITTAQENENYEYPAEATDADIEDNLVYSLDSSPEGMIIIPDTGAISWLPNPLYVESVQVQHRRCLAPPEPITDVSVEEKWHWQGPISNPNAYNVFGPVLAGQFTDDNGDGEINATDSTDLIFISFANQSEPAYLNLIEAETGAEIWSISTGDINHLGIPAIGDIDQDGNLEIIVDNINGTILLAFEHTGDLKWNEPTNIQTSTNSSNAISLADLNSDGSVEILYRDRAYNDEGIQLWRGGYDAGGISVTAPIVADIDLNGSHEIIAGRSVYDHLGNLIWHHSNIPNDGYNAVGNFDQDDFAEIVLVSEGSVYLLEHTGEIIWGPVTIPGGGFGGAPTIADLDADGAVEIGVAGGQSYVVLETNGDIKWIAPTKDESSNRTGSSVFDFNGDGAVEILYSDEEFLHIFNGENGQVLYQLPNISSTRGEYPTIVDIDNDGNSEILVGSGSTGFGGIDAVSTGGVRVLESQNEDWVATRRIWNQHAYSINNINDDGTLPAYQDPSWLLHNTYRLNNFSSLDALALPDLSISEFNIQLAGNHYTIGASVRNRGNAIIRSGALVNFYNTSQIHENIEIGSVVLPEILPGEALEVVLENISPSEITGDILAIADPVSEFRECVENNNSARLAHVIVRAEDSSSASTEQEFFIRVSNINNAPELISVPVTETSTSQTYSYQVEISDADIGDSIEYQLISSPAGMSIDPTNGLIEWNPTSSDSGENNIIVEITDLAGNTILHEFTLNVSHVNDAPEYTSQPVLTGQSNAEYQYQTIVSDPNNDVLIHAAGALPDGASYNQISGFVHWAPSEEFTQSLNIVNTQCLSPAPDRELFEPVVKWAWSNSVIEPEFTQVIMTPLVAQTNDDNLDGVIDQFDIPDVIFTANNSSPENIDWSGLVRIVSGADGTELNAFSHAMDIDGAKQLAIGDIDGDSEIEIVAPGIGGKLYVFEVDGTIKWIVEGISVREPYLADINSDGEIEIITDLAVLNSDGEVLWDVTQGGRPIVADFDLDGDSDVLLGGSLYDNEGNLIWQATHPYNGVMSGKNGIGNFDGDPYPELVLVVNGGAYLFDDNGVFLYQGGVAGGGNGGPPTIADFNGDGALEVGLAGRTSYTLLNNSFNTLWNLSVNDTSSSSTGSSVFDFDGDGRPEVVYADENTLHVIDGTSGEVLFQTVHSSGTLYEYPVVVDLDNDHSAEIVVAQNDYLGGYSGIRVYEDINDSWANTRGIWNQYAYHIDNVNADGSIPTNPENSWLTHNSFRLNTFPDLPSRGLVDLRVGNIQWNENTQTLTVEVRNVGLATLFESTIVNIYGAEGPTGTPLATDTVSNLESGESVELAFSIQMSSIEEGVYAAVNETLEITECESINNVARAAFFSLNVQDPGGLSDQQNYFVNIIQENSAPIFTSVEPSQVLVAGTQLVYQLTAEDLDIGDALRYGSSNAPSGFRVNSETGEIVWEIRFSSVGNTTFEVFVEDLSGVRSIQTWDLTVRGNTAPAITSSQQASVIEGSTYSQTITGFDAENDELIFSLDYAPSAATIDSQTGNIQWDPAGAQAQALILPNPSCRQNSFEVENPENLPDLAISNLVFNSDTNQITLDVHNLGLADVDYATVSLRHEYGGPTGGLSFSIYGLASGESLSVSPNFESHVPSGNYSQSILATISGNDLVECNSENNSARAYSFVARAEDEHGLHTTQSWLVNVIETNEPPTINPIESVTLIAGDSLFTSAVVEDTDRGDAHVYSLVNAPTGMEIESAYGDIRWVTTNIDVGIYDVIIRVTDLNGLNADLLFTVNVSPPSNEAPNFNSDSIILAQENNGYSYFASAIDPNGDELEFISLISPEGSVINSDTGVVTWDPSSEYVQSIEAHNTNCRNPSLPITSSEPELKWEWNSSDVEPDFDQVMMTPLVAQTNDDNGDGSIDDQDIPDVIFTSYAGSNGNNADGIIRILSGDNGNELATFNNILVEGYANIAVADIDNDNEIEILAVARNSGLVAINLDGSELWRSSVNFSIGWGGPSVADIDADGNPEILISRYVFNNHGELLWSGSNIGGQFGGFPVVADINIDGEKEILLGLQIYSPDGTQIRNGADGFIAIANFDETPEIERVLVQGGSVSLYDFENQLIWSTPIPGGGGGAPTIADIDGDGLPEVGVAGASHYAAFDTDGTLLWQHSTIDASSGMTGSSVFDFNGDNQAEIVYADEYTLYILDGMSGSVLSNIPHSSGTTLEYPVIADIDNDNHADIVVSANELIFLRGGPPGDYFNGIRVFQGSSNEWINTRSIWNQHAYSINNVNDDGTIPETPEASWISHNTFRLNSFPDRSPSGLSDLRVGNIQIINENTISAIIQNIGLADLGSSVEVEFHEGNPSQGGTLIGTENILELESGAEAIVNIEYNTNSLITDIYVRVNSSESVEECQYTNNDAQAALFSLRVEDPEGLSDNQLYLVNVQNLNSAPEITNTETNFSITSGEYFSIHISASDSDRGDTLSYALNNTPDGMLIDPITGRLTWTPSEEQLGETTVDVISTDLSGLSDIITLNFEIYPPINNTPIRITSSPAGESSQGASYSYQVETDYTGSGNLIYSQTGYYQASIDTQGVLTWDVPENIGNRSSTQNNGCSIPFENDAPYFNLTEWDQVQGSFADGTNTGQTVELYNSGLSAYFEGNGPPLYIISDFETSDGAYQFDVRIDGPADDDGIGIEWGHSNPEHTYMLLWGGATAPSIWKYDSSVPLDGINAPNPEERTLLVAGPDVPWQVDVNYSIYLDIKPGSTGVYIKNADTNEYIFSAQVIDDQYPSGHIGFFVLSQDNVSVSAREIERAPAPDLIVSDLNFVDEETLDIVSATVINRGAAISEATNLNIRLVEHDSEGIIVNSNDVASTEIQSLLPGDSHTINFEFDTLAPQFNRIVAYVDEQGQFLNSASVTECFERNNRRATPLMNVTVDDQLGQSDSQRFSIDVDNVNEVPAIISIAPSYALIGETYEYSVIATDPDIGDQLTSEVINGPINSEFYLGSTKFVWQPQPADQGSDYPITLRFTDLDGLYTEESFTVSVHQKPEITSTPVYVARTGNIYNYDVEAIDNDGDTLSYSLLEAPAGMSIDSDSGIISWTASIAGVVETVIVEVSDGRGGRAQQEYPLAVLSPGEENTAPSLASNSLSTTAQQRVEYTSTFTVVDPDGNTPLYSLLEGPNGMVIGEADGILRWTPPFTQIVDHPVTVQVHDQRGGFDTFTYVVSIPTSSNTAPSITSSPIQTADIDEPYNYQVLATDPENDNLNYRLTIAPWGMTIDQEGLISWTPTGDQMGTRDVTVRVTDSFGNYVDQSYDISISFNTAPAITSSPNIDGITGQPYQYQVEATDIETSSLVYSLSVAPSGMSIDSTSGLITWLPSYDQDGPNPVTVNVSDGELFDEQSYNVTVELGEPQNLIVEATLSAESFDLGGSTTLTVSTEFGLSSLIVTATMNGENLILDGANQAVITPTASGLYTIVATADDGRGPVTDTITFRALDPTDSTAPTVTIHSPINESVLTRPSDIVATVTDANLESYRVLYKRKSEENWLTLAESTEEVINGPVAIFDTTQLLNGIYQIAVEATDVNGQSEIENVAVTVDGDLKVGNFSFTVRDLTIPLEGVPIEVNRTYDSRRRHENLDFGFGWSVDYQNIQIEESRTPGIGWELNEYPSGPLGILTTYCVEPMGTPTVTVTLPDGDTERFEIAASPSCLESVAQFDVSLEFNPVGDTQSTLTTSGASGLRVVGDRLEILGDGFPADPNEYVLTTRAGYIYHLNQDFGIEMVETPNGHTLTYSDSGIVHSSGKSITFERDSEGLITDIIDPVGNRLVYGRDENGDLRTVTDRDTTSITQYEYNTNHGLVEIIDPLNRRVLRNIYDDEGRLTGQCDQNDVCKTFNHDLDARSSIVTDLDGRSTIFNYDDRGNVLQEIKVITDGNYVSDIVTTYTYDANDNQETKTIDGVTWTYSYNELNELLSFCNSLNLCTIYNEYNNKGQELRVTDPRGNFEELAYDENGNKTSHIMPATLDPTTGDEMLPSFSNSYDDRGRLISETDLRGLATSYTYYPNGHPNGGQKHTESNPVSGTTTYTYYANNNVETETHERTVNGSVFSETTTYTYDLRDRLTRTTFHDGTYTETEFDLAGNVDRERDRFGVWTDYDYDAYGRLTRTDYADGSFEVRTYTREGLLETVTAPNGTITRNEYDDAGRLWRVHNDTDGTFTETRYNANGWVIEEYDQLRNLTEYEYDDAGRREAVIRNIDGTTQRHEFTYYPNGELHTETDANGHTTTYILNELDQRIEVQYHNGTTMQERFDFMGTRTRSIDQEDRSTQFGYDDLGRLQTVTPLVSIDGTPVPDTIYTYDEVGNRLTQTDAEGRTTSWTYDLHGRVLTRTLPLLQQESFVYNDGQGCVQTDGINCATVTSPRTVVHTDFNGDTITTAYDIMGRTIAVQYSKDGNSEVFTYYTNGQVHTVTDQHGTTTYTYDSNNRLLTELKSDGTQMRYAYDAVGNRTLVEITRGGSITSTTTYTYDDLNRLENVIDSSGTTTYTYDDVGNLDTVTYPNGLLTDYDYNAVNQLTDVFTRDAINMVINHFNYSLTLTGRREIITELDGRTTAYCYDNLYRLTDEVVYETTPATPPLTGCITDTTGADYVANYDYDWVGNRTYETVDGVQTAYSYDDNDRLTSTGGTVYTYDENGNTITETLDGVVKTYTWDGKNKLINFDNAGSVTEYTYNHNGIRDSKTKLGVTTSFIVDENRDYAQALEEVQSGTATVSYTYGHDLVNQDRSGNTSFYHYDGLGSTRLLSDGLGTFTDTYDYEAFGEVLNETGTTENSYKYTGEQYDASLEQIYLRARYYDQSVGRFTQQDVWQGVNAQPITLNKYLYGDSDPASNNDPTGNYSMSSLSSAMNISSNLVVRSVGNQVLKKSIQKAVTSTIKQSGRLALRQARRMVRKCIYDRDKCGLTIPTLIVGSDNYEAAEHIRFAQKYILAGKGFVLRYKNRPRTNFHTGRCGPSRPGTDCDEYPFFRSVQGGPGRIVSFRRISSSHNRSSGASFGALVRMARLNTSQKKIFLVLAPTDSPITVPIPIRR